MSDPDTPGTPPAHPGMPSGPMNPTDPADPTDPMDLIAQMGPAVPADPAGAVDPAAQAPPADPARPGSRRLAAFALLISVVSLGVAATALLRSPTATSPSAYTAASADGARTVTVMATPSVDDSGLTATATGDPETAPSSSEDATIDPRALPAPTADYQLVYEEQALTLRPAGNGCGKAREREVDLDQPAVGATDDALDLHYRSSCNSKTPALKFANARLATAKNSAASPQECADAIRTAPIGTTVAPSQDLVLCAVTNGVGAPDEPNRAKIALVVINSVGTDQTVVLTVKTWEIPH